MNLLEILHYVRRLCHQNMVAPSNLKITIEITEPKDYYAAEYALRQQAQGIIFDFKTIDEICSGHEFTVTGIRFKVLRGWQEPASTRHYHICPYCKGHL